MSEPTDPIAQIAEEFVERLFTNGGGDVADRLVLTVDAHPRRELGGWCRGAIIDRLVVLLRAQRTEGRPPETPQEDLMDSLHAVFTQHGIASRADLPHALISDLVGWAARKCREAKK
jgi:hypothetical protein